MKDLLKGDKQKASPFLIVGAGNPLRGDDGFGSAVIDSLGAADLPAEIQTVKMSGDGFQLLSLWKGFDKVILCDALMASKNIGELMVFELGDKAVEKEIFPFSTHSFSLAETIELGRMLNELPARLCIVGVRASRFTLGQEMSPVVKNSVSGAVDIIREKIGQWR